MIDEKMVGRVDNLAVHLDMLPLVETHMNPADGIPGVFGLIEPVRRAYRFGLAAAQRANGLLDPTTSNPQLS